MDADAYDFWLFDLDGTIVDVEFGHIRSVFDRVGNRLDHRFTDREATTVWYGLDGPRESPLADLAIDPGRFWRVFHQVEDPAARAAASYRYEDATFVGDLPVPVGLVTHCQSYLARPVIDRLELGDWFDTVICCSEEIGWKPDPAPLERAMVELGVAAATHEGVLIGDGLHDVRAARNAGLDAVHVERHDPAVRSQRVDADVQVTCLTQLDGADTRVGSVSSVPTGLQSP